MHRQAHVARLFVVTLCHTFFHFFVLLYFFSPRHHHHSFECHSSSNGLVFMVLRACCACPLNNLMDGCHCFFTLLKRMISFMVSLGLLRSPLGGTMFGQQRVNTQHTFILFLTLTDVSSICETHIYECMPSTAAFLSPCTLYISTMSVGPHLLYMCDNKFPPAT